MVSLADMFVAAMLVLAIVMVWSIFQLVWCLLTFAFWFLRDWFQWLFSSSANSS